MTVEEFESQAPAIIAEMKQQQAIFDAGYVTGKGPTAEERETASTKWDELCDHLKDLCAELFRDVGGQTAFETFTHTLVAALQKHGGRHHLLLNDPKFLWGMLIRATSKEQQTPITRGTEGEEQIEAGEPQLSAPHATEDDDPKFWRRIGTHLD